MRAPERRVGVVVATRDRRPELEHTLERLAALPERPRVVVVDNGSSDDTAATVRAGHPGVEVIELGEDHGAAARTVGARRLTTPYVAFSDDDSWWAPGALRRAAELLDGHPRLGLVAARILVGPDEREDATCAAMASSPLASDDGLPGTPVLGFVACGAVVRRSAFLSTGGFDRRLQIGGEEELLALDLAAAGWALAYVPEVVAHHHPSSGRDAAGRRRRMVRNELWSAWLRGSSGAAARRSLRVLAGMRSDPSVAVGVLAALRGAPWVARSRRPLPDEVERARATLQDGDAGA